VMISRGIEIAIAGGVREKVHRADYCNSISF